MHQDSEGAHVHRSSIRCKRPFVRLAITRLRDPESERPGHDDWDRNLMGQLARTVFTKPVSQFMGAPNAPYTNFWGVWDLDALTDQGV